MATARKRGNAYQIRVSLGYDLYGKQIIKSTTWTPPPEMTKTEIRKELERLKLQFEDECFKTPDVSTIKFGQFAEQWFEESIIACNEAICPAAIAHELSVAFRT